MTATAAASRPAGTRLLAHGRGILQQVERARQDLEDQRGAASGLLSIGLPPSISRSLTAAMVDAFREHFPRATISVVEGLSTDTLEWLAQGRVDCAVVYNATPAAAIDLAPVLQERLYLLSARSAAKMLVGRPVALADVAQRALVIPARPHAIRMRLETVLAEAWLKPRVALEIESVPAILDLVQRRALHAVLSLNAVRGSGREPAFTVRPVAETGRDAAGTNAERATGGLATTAPGTCCQIFTPQPGLPSMRLCGCQSCVCEHGQAQMSPAQPVPSCTPKEPA